MAGNWPDFDKAMGAGISSVLTGKTTVADWAKTACDEPAKAFTTK